MWFFNAVNAWLARWLAAVLVILFAVATFSVVSGEQHHSQDTAQIRSLVGRLQMQNDCLTSFANQMYDSLHPRQSASEALQGADTAFNVALLKVINDALTGDPAAHADALVLKARLEAKTGLAESLSRDRARNPYPSPPKKVCPT